MAEMPISSVDAAFEINGLINKKGIGSLTSKIIRRHLEAKFNCSLSDFKTEIDNITIQQIQEVNAKKNASTGDGEENDSESEDENSNSVESLSSSETDNEVDDLEVKKPTSRKRKAKDINEDDTASSTRRSTRRSTATKSKRSKNQAEKKTKRKGNSAFTRVCLLSDELANFFNTKYMRRHVIVKQMWNYFREHDLMDPKDRRKVLLDEPLQKIFGPKKSIVAFGMMSGLKEHLIDVKTLDPEFRTKVEAEIKELFPEDEVNDAENEKDENSNLKFKKAKKKVKKETNGPRKETAFTKICVLSDELVDVLGHRYLRRCDIVKQMWAYFREHQLFDPLDKRMVILDEPLRKVYKGEKKMRAFGLMSGLKSHIEVAQLTDEKRHEIELKLDSLKVEEDL